jgi:hypothetical protein
MRYKVVVDSNLDAFQQALRLLDDRKVRILLKNDRRQLVAVEDPPEDVRLELTSLGARVSPDVAYAPETTFG